MSTPTYTELLAAAKSALDGTLTREAAELTINGRTIESFDLKELRGLIDWLERKVNRAANSRRAFVPKFRSPG